jgi:hypothetical protein
MTIERLSADRPDEVADLCDVQHLLESRGERVSQRLLWAVNRFRLESNVLRDYSRSWFAHPHVDDGHCPAVRLAGWLLRRLGLYRRGLRNATDVLVRPIELPLPALPEAFDGYTILHLSDPHFEELPGQDERIARAVADREVDLCVLTGDYRGEMPGGRETCLRSLARVVEAISAREGIVGVLGNHDQCDLVDPMERMGIRLLINESMFLHRAGQAVRVVGTDDPHYYLTSLALRALREAGEEFAIALVHSPELYRSAEEAGIDLYLCGHTHGGQICLPGGRPLVLHMRRARRFYRDVWRYGRMTGVTTVGCGASGVPVRFHTRSEVLLLTLRSGRCISRQAGV